MNGLAFARAPGKGVFALLLALELWGENLLLYRGCEKDPGPLGQQFGATLQEGRAETLSSVAGETSVLLESSHTQTRIYPLWPFLHIPSTFPTLFKPI